jgi:hypothetical protein
MAKKTRTRLKWALDYDYLAKLSTEQRAWLEKFNDEYYRCEVSSETKNTNAIYAANNASERDIRTTVPAKVAEKRKNIWKYHPSLKVRFYHESDYATVSKNPEEALIDLIDSAEELYAELVNVNRRAAVVEIISVQKFLRKFSPGQMHLNSQRNSLLRPQSTPAPIAFITTKLKKIRSVG